MSAKKRKKIFCTFIILLCVFSFYVQAEIQKDQTGKVTTISETVGDMDFVYNGRTGVSLSIMGSSFLTTSSFAIISQGWTEKYIATMAEPYIYDFDIESYKGGKKITIHHKSSSDPLQLISGTQTFVLLPDNTFTVSFDLKYTGDKPAYFEGQLGGVNSIPVAGQKYSVTKGDEKIKGTVPLEAISPNVGESTIAKGFDCLRLNTRLGDIDILSNPSDDMIFFDYRKNLWAEKISPMFWCGYLERPVENGTINYETTIKFPVRDKSAQKVEVTQKTPTTAIPDAKMSKWEQDFIMPTPKQISYTDNIFKVNADTKVYIGENGSKILDNSAAFLVDDLKDYFGVELEIIQQEAPAATKNAIILGDKTRYSSPVKICKNAGLCLSEHKEAYCLTVNDDLITIAANTEQGLFYGVTTLVQLAKFEDGKLSFKGAEIIDYPAMDIRGIHSFSGRNAGGQISKAVKNLMARYKINTFAWQCDYINWKTKKKAAHPVYGMDKEDARKVVVAADRCNVEFMPFINSLGHMEWLFANGQNLDLAEDPEYAYAYCPTNPRTYDFMFKLYDEVLDFCIDKPRYFHIGHDEVTIVGRFPYRSKHLGKSATDLVIDDINKLHKWFADKDVKIALWGDMFLHGSEASTSAHAPSPTEAQKRRDALPDDALVFDWHYEVNPPEKFVSLNLFKNEGFKTAGATWSTPENIANMSKAVADNKLEGLLQTTWAGYNFAIDNNVSAWYQYWAYLLAAQYSWTGDNVPEKELDFSAPKLFHDIWTEVRPVMQDKPGHYFDLSRLYNRKLADDSRGTGWLGYGDSMDLSAFPTGKVNFGDDRYLIKKAESGNAAILMSGNLNPKGDFPDVITIKTDSLFANEVNFLLTAAFKSKDGTKVGEIVFEFEDGTKEHVSLVYGKSVFSFTDIRVSPKAQIAWIGKTKSGSEACVNKLSWINTNPEKKITEISIKSEQTDSTLILFAITAVD